MDLDRHLSDIYEDTIQRQLQNYCRAKMGTWSYRIVEFSRHFALHEVHYDENDRVTACTARPIRLVRESPEDIIGDLALMLKHAQHFKTLSVHEIPGAVESDFEMPSDDCD